MGGEDDAIQREELGRNDGLSGEDVEAGASEVSACDRVGESSLVHASAAGRIHQDGPFLHREEPLA